jgi:hypothetical protein
MKITTKIASLGLLVVAGSLASGATMAAEYQTCVTGMFGLGYVAEVKHQNPITGKISEKYSNVAVGETKCHTFSVPHIANIKVRGAGFASQVTSVSGMLAAGIMTGGACIAATAVAGGVGLCSPLIQGVMGTTYGLIHKATQDPGTFYSGVAKRIELRGITWDPSAEAVEYFNRKNHPESFSMQLQCSGVDGASTKSNITVKFHHKGKVVSESTARGCHGDDRFISEKTTSIDKVTVRTDGGDAMWIDYAILSAATKGKPVQWGGRGNKGYCLSTDRKDAEAWKKKIDKRGCFVELDFMPNHGVTGHKK